MQAACFKTQKVIESPYKCMKSDVYSKIIKAWTGKISEWLSCREEEKWMVVSNISITWVCGYYVLYIFQYV